MSDRDVTLPVYGVNDDKPYSDQPVGTTRGAQNMRGQDPVEKRERPAQRSGLTDVTAPVRAQVNGSSKVQHIAAISFSREALSYTEVTSPLEGDEVWSQGLSDGQGNPSRAVAVDGQGAHYYVDGDAGLIKYNADGQEVWKVTLPTVGTDQVIRTLEIDAVGNLYCATSQRGNITSAVGAIGAAGWAAVEVSATQEDNRIFRVSQVEDKNFDQEPQVTMEFPVEGFIPDLKVRFGFLYACRNRPDPDDTSVGYTADVLVISGAGVDSSQLTTDPVVIASAEVPYPANSIGVNDSGEIVGCSQPFDDRNLNLKHPELARPHDATSTPGFWDPTQLRNSRGRIHSWFIPTSGLLNTAGSFPADGEEVDVWADASGNQRDFSFANNDLAEQIASDKPAARPRFDLRAIGDAPGVFFDRADDTGLSSGINEVITPEGRYSVKTPWPSYGVTTQANNAQFAFYMVLRFDNDQVGSIIAQDRNTPGPTVPHLALWSNLDDTRTPGVLATATQGWIRLQDFVTSTDPYPPDSGGVGPSAGLDWPDGADLSADSPVLAIVAFVIDGGIDTATTPNAANAAVTKSFFEVNGTRYDRWASSEFFTDQPVTLGWGVNVTGAGYNGGGINPNRFEGHVVEMLCVGREAPADPAEDEDRVLSHQKSGEGGGTATTVDDANHDATRTNADADEHERIIGYLAHKYGLQGKLPSSGDFEHPYAAAPPTKDTDGPDLTDYYTTLNGVLWKLGTGNLPVKWFVKRDNAGGGIGFGVSVGDGVVTSVGPEAGSTNGAASSDPETVRVYRDDGDSATQTGVTRWTTLGVDRGYADHYPKLARDADGNVYIPRYSSESPISSPVGVVALNNTSAEFLWSTSATANLVMPCHAVAVPATNPDYGAASAINRPLFMAVAGLGEDFIATDIDAARRVALVNKAPATQQPRVTNVYAVADGAIRRFNQTGWSTFSSLGATDIVPGTGSGAAAGTFSTSASAFFSSCELFGDLYITDGVYPRRLRPRLGSPPGVGQIEFLKADDGGEILEGARLLAAWRGRLVMAHGANQPYTWLMSQIGKPRNFNIAPAVPFVGQAVSSVNSTEAGSTPDIVNTIVPWTDDLLLFGGDKSITALMGDPTGQGVIARGELGGSMGQFQLVTDGTGMAFGRPWAKDKRDVLFFLSARAHAYALTPGGKPQPISDRAIEKRLSTIDFSTHYVEARWNWEDNTVHFWVLPFGDTATAQQHWVFDVQRGKMMQVGEGDPVHVGWWPDRFAGPQPTTTAIVDGDDPADRAMWIGFEDGRVRKWDSSALNDDRDAVGSPVKIDSYVDIGPHRIQGHAGELMFDQIAVELDRNQGGAQLEYLTAETGDLPAGPAVSGLELFSGYNPPFHERVAGNYCAFRVRNAAQDSRFAIDRITMRITPAGDRRLGASSS